MIALIGCGLAELAAGRHGRVAAAGLALITTPAIATGGAIAIAWTAFKVGALSFGGGFVIIPLALKRGIVITLVLAALTGALGVLAGLPVP